MKSALKLIYALQRRLWRVLRPRTLGVKVMVFDGRGEVLLVRNSYGRSEQFLLPGGGIRRGEAPEAAALREVREELGCGLCEVAFVSEHASQAEGKRDTVYLFRARLDGTPKADGFEVEEARFFRLDALPDSVSPATRRRIEEHLGLRAVDGRW